MECGDICGKALQVKVCRATLCTAHLQQQWLLSSSSRGILIKYVYRAWAATVPDIQGTSSSCDGPPFSICYLVSVVYFIFRYLETWPFTSTSKDASPLASHGLVILLSSNPVACSQEVGHDPTAPVPAAFCTIAPCRGIVVLLHCQAGTRSVRAFCMQPEFLHVMTRPHRHLLRRCSPSPICRESSCCGTCARTTWSSTLSESQPNLGSGLDGSRYECKMHLARYYRF